VLLNLETGAYYRLNATGAAIWELLEAPASVDDVSVGLAVEVTKEASELQGDVEWFLGELTGRGLVEVDA
jgi:hypothetical protein